MDRADIHRPMDLLQQRNCLAPAGFTRLLISTVRRVSATLVCWSARSSQRRHLRTLSTSQLADVGLTGEDVTRETRKFFWEP